MKQFYNMFSNQKVSTMSTQLSWSHYTELLPIKNKNEFKIKLGDRYNYIDLLLYNIKFKCYVVVEIKISELKKEHIGQIQTYMNYIDKNIKTIDEDRTDGLIICRKNNEFIIEYCSDDRIIYKEYELV